MFVGVCQRLLESVGVCWSSLVFGWCLLVFVGVYWCLTMFLDVSWCLFEVVGV